MLITWGNVVMILLATFSAVRGFGQGETKVNADGTSGTLSFKPPDLNDEEAQSQHMPQQFKCEGCKALAHLFKEAFKKLIDKHKSKKGVLPESEIIDTAEAVCKQDFNNYGIKEVKGVKHLSGPGLEYADTPGVMQGGGKWPARFMQQCDVYLGEVGEEELFEEYKSNKNFEKFLCYGSGELGVCRPSKQKKDKAKVKKKKQQKVEL